jgi:hypothetical protein
VPLGVGGRPPIKVRSTSMDALCTLCSAAVIELRPYRESSQSCTRVKDARAWAASRRQTCTFRQIHVKNLLPQTRQRSGRLNESHWNRSANLCLSERRTADEEQHGHRT